MKILFFFFSILLCQSGFIQLVEIVVYLTKSGGLLNNINSPLLPLFLHLWSRWHFLSKAVSQAGDWRLSDVILHTDVRRQPWGWLGGKMTSLALTVMASYCKKLAILFLLFSFYCLFHSLGSVHSCLAVLLLKLWHSPSKALTLLAAPDRRTVTNNSKPGLSRKGL